MPIEMLSGFTANISMETQIQQNRRYTTIQLDIIHTGDCLKILKTLPDDSVHCCVTSPPYYALRDYGMEAQIGRETTPKEYISRLTEVFTEVRRVLRPDGTLWLNISDTYAGKGNQGDFVDPKNPNGRNGQAVALNNKVWGSLVSTRQYLLFHPQSLTNIDHIRIADSIQLRNLLVGRAVFSCNTGKRISALHDVILCG